MSLDFNALLGIVAGASGLLFSHFNSLIPSRDDFSGKVNLRSQEIVEAIASNHFFLLKECLESTQGAGFEAFDNLIRGDGRQSRDYFFDHSRLTIDMVHEYWGVKRKLNIFNISHNIFFVSSIFLIFLGVSSVIFPSIKTYLSYAIYVLMSLEFASIFVSYFVCDIKKS